MKRHMKDRLRRARNAGSADEDRSNDASNDTDAQSSVSIPSNKRSCLSMPFKTSEMSQDIIGSYLGSSFSGFAGSSVSSSTGASAVPSLLSANWKYPNNISGNGNNRGGVSTGAASTLPSICAFKSVATTTTTAMAAPAPTKSSGNPTAYAATTTSTTSASNVKKSPSPSLLGEDMSQLSLLEQQQGHRDVIGDVNVVREDAELIQTCLANLDEQLASIRRKVAYDKAVFLSPKYVQDPNLRLMFLRADNFDPAKTAQKLVRHFETKLKLFGEEKLVKTIMWDDLDEQDRSAYHTGASIMSGASSDSSGRQVYYSIFALRKYKTRESQLRAVWYIFMRGIQNNQSSQQKGLVMVSYVLGTTPAKFYKEALFQIQQRLDNILPIKFTAIHFCFDNRTLIGPVFSGIMSMISLNERSRIRTHVGSHIECRYSLAAFGIPEKDFPLEVDGRLNAGRIAQLHHQATQTELRSQEVAKNLQQCGYIECPTHNDVLLGRGHPYQKFEGNLRLLAVAEKAKPQYDSAKMRSTKTQIAADVVGIIQSLGGRFLKRDEVQGMWVEVDSEVAREKVSMSFRNLSRKTRTGQKKNGVVHDNDAVAEG